MLVHVLLQIPGHIYELLPLAVLIGTLVAMSLLASGPEYTVMRASGCLCCAWAASWCKSAWCLPWLRC